MLTQAEVNTCPAAAVLVVLAAPMLSVLSAPSCEFLCNSNGGEGVATAVQSRLMAAEDVSNPSELQDALFEGIEETVRTLQKNAPVPDTTAHTLVPGLLPVPTKPPEGRLSSEGTVEQLEGSEVEKTRSFRVKGKEVNLGSNKKCPKAGYV